MEENQKVLLKRILTILETCDPTESKTLTTADNLISYIRRAYRKKLTDIPQTYRIFAQQAKHHYPSFKKLKTNQAKIDLLKKVVSECHTALEEVS